jgi:hypothetical protein
MFGVKSPEIENLVLAKIKNRIRIRKILKSRNLIEIMKVIVVLEAETIKEPDLNQIA